ncbi:MAG: DMT family transporter [Verrucomicrobiota bacterium]
MFAAFLTTILFSLSAICGHRSAKLIGGTEANFWRASTATLLLGIWAYTAGCGLAGAAFPVFLLSGICGIGMGDVAFFQALPRLGSRLSLLLVHCLTAPLAALLERLWLGTRLTGWQLAFGAMALAGVGIALSPGAHLRLSRRDLWVGSLAGVLAAVGGAGGAVLSRQAYRVMAAAGEHLDPFNAGYQRMLGGVLIAGLCLVAVKAGGVVRGAAAGGAGGAKWSRVWYWILLNALAGQTFGVSSMQWALETTPAGVVLPIIALAPIVVMPLAYVLEGERPSRRSILGGVIAVCGVILLTASR